MPRAESFRPVSNYPKTLLSPGFYGGYTSFSDSCQGAPTRWHRAMPCPLETSGLGPLTVREKLAEIGHLSRIEREQPDRHRIDQPEELAKGLDA